MEQRHKRSEGERRHNGEKTLATVERCGHRREQKKT